MREAAKESWGSGAAYELRVGRWSRRVAHQFIDWLTVAPRQIWGDVGCGTGALAECFLGDSAPAAVFAVDRSEACVCEARARIGDARARFEVGDACALTWPAESCDATVSGLVLHSVPDSDAMAKEMACVTRPGARVAAYVWDYAGGMQMIRHFWDGPIELNRGDSKLDRAERFPICQPEPLEQLFRRAGLISVSVCAIDVPTVFRDFEDYRGPFPGKQGAAPTYLAALPVAMRDRIRDTLKARLVAAADGSIAMTARAWAVQGTVRPDRSARGSDAVGIRPPEPAGSVLPRRRQTSGRTGKPSVAAHCRGVKYQEIPSILPWRRQPAGTTFPAVSFGKIACPKLLKLCATSMRRSPKAISQECSRHFLPTSAGLRRKEAHTGAFRSAPMQ